MNLMDNLKEKKKLENTIMRDRCLLIEQFVN